MCKSVVFRIVDKELEVSGGIFLYGGIGIYNDDDTLINVLCGCCGMMLKPEQVKIVKEGDFLPISSDIKHHLFGG